MMSTEFIGFTLDVIGKIMVAYTAFIWCITDFGKSTKLMKRCLGL